MLDSGFSLQQNNWSRGGLQQLAFCVTDKAMLFNCFKVGHHQGKGLVHAQFAVAEFDHRLGVRRITCEMKSAKTFDGNDVSLC